MASILLVVDSAALAQSITAQLTVAGHVVRWVPDRRQALADLQVTTPDMILADADLPEGQGAGLALAELFPSIPAVVIGADPASGEAGRGHIQALPRGCDAAVVLAAVAQATSRKGGPS